MVDIFLDPAGIYFAYLRKSREDRVAEEYGGDEDTLARHEYIINGLANRYHIAIAKWYKEVVSGETITDRPEMQQMLRDIEIVKPHGVLVVEVERLSRGNPQDQGRVTDTFKYANTLIITPMKIYDLTKENDEEWLDFGLMRSRMEYRTIKRRLQNGRTTSAMQGKYIGNVPPYGWIRQKLEHEKGYTLAPCPDTSWVLKLIYTLMDSGTKETNFLPVGASITARTLDQLGIKPPRGEHWDIGSITRIAKNPANIGMVRIGYRKQVKTMVNGELKSSRPINQDCILVPARWKGQIDQEVYERVCLKIKSHAKSTTFNSVKSPLAGVIYCSVCGKVMRRRPAGGKNRADTLQCRTYHCPTVGSYYELIESRLVDSLDNWLKDYKIKIDTDAPEDWEGALDTQKHLLMEIEQSIGILNHQNDKVHACFEQDIYDLETFVKRSQSIKAEIEQKEKLAEEIKKEIVTIREKLQNKTEFVPYFEGILDSYRASTDPVYKNTLIKKIVDRVEYTKMEKSSRNGESNDKFELNIHVKI